MAQAIEGRVYAQIRDSKVHWIFTADDLPEWAEGTGEFEIQTIDITDMQPMPAAGWNFVDGQLTPPPEEPTPVPQEVTRFQAFAALHLAGFLATVEAMMADPATDPLTVLAWKNAQVFKRYSPMVLDMAQALGLSEEQLDSLFITAASIE